MIYPHPVIFVPGILGSYLRDLYPLPPETIWAAISKDYERSALHPDDLRYEALQPSNVVPDQIIEIAYKELIEELRHNLRDQADKPVPVYPFSYDWRQPLEVTEKKLGDFITSVIERTKLLRHYHKAGYGDDARVNLIGHSMGGLVIAGYLERFGANAPVHKVVSIASPFRGSVEAIVKMATGVSSIAGPLPSSREREPARLTPALYHLLPSFAEGVEIDPSFGAANLFDRQAWQPTVIETLEEFIRLNGVNATNKQSRRQQAEMLFSNLLAGAKAHRSRIESLNLANTRLVEKDWLCLVGVDSKTRTGLSVKPNGGTPQFVISKDQIRNQWDSDAPIDRWNTGDGTVPLRGAIPGFLPLGQVICLKPSDYAFGEIGDRVLAGTDAVGFHAALPNMDLVHRLIVRHLRAQADQRGSTWGRALPGVAFTPPFDLEEK